MTTRASAARHLSPRRAALRSGAAMALALAASPGLAGPEGGVVTAGSASISTAGKATDIAQSTDRVVIEWDSFDVDADESVNFAQPSSSAIALNRVNSSDPSKIHGAITGNGNVWVINRSGILVGDSATIDVGGLLLSTVDVDGDANFMAGGRATLNRAGDPAAKIELNGEISFAEAGLAGFVAPEIVNRGRIAGKLGRVVMAGKESVAVDVSGDGMFAIDLADAAPATAAKIVQDGEISVEGGVVVIDALSVRDAIEGTVSVGGVISAASASAEGGTVILSGNSVTVSGAVEAVGATTGGTVAIDGGVLHVASGGVVDVSGGAGGGAIRIGKGDPEAARVLVSAGGALRADGGAGAGGEVSLWSKDGTAMRGAVSASGLTGGLVSISSAGLLLFDGAVDVSGTLADGAVIFDPLHIVIGDLGDDDAEITDESILAGEGAGETWFISATALGALTGDVTLEATDTITLKTALDFDATSLSLIAGGALYILNDIDGAGDLTLRGGAIDGIAGIHFGDPVSINVVGNINVAAPGGIFVLDPGPGDVIVGATGEDDALLTDDGVLDAADSADQRRTVSSGAVDGLSGAVTISATDDLIIDAPIDFTGSALSLIAGDDLVLDADVSSAGSLLLRAGALSGDGSILVSGSRTLTAGTTLTLDISGAGIVDGAAMAASDTLTLISGGAANVESLSLAGNLRVDAGAGVTARTYFDIAGDVGIDAHGAVVMALNNFSVGGDFTLTTDGGAVALGSDQAAFGGLVSIDTLNAAGTNGGALQMLAAGDLSFGALRARSVAVTAQGALTGTEAATVLGSTTLISRGGAISFLAADNRFGGQVRAVSKSDTNLRGDISIRSATSLVSSQMLGADLFLDVTGNLTETAAFDIAGNADITVTGTATLVAPTGGAANAFDGRVEISAAALTLAIDRGVRVSGLSNVTDLVIDAAGNVTQLGGASATGAGVISTVGDILLDHADNSLSGPLSLSGDEVTVDYAGAIVLGAGTSRILTISAASLSQTAAVTTTETLALDILGDADLSRADNGLTAVTGAVGGVAALRDADGFAVTGWTGGQALIGSAMSAQAGGVSLGGDFGAGSAVHAAGDVTVLAEGARFAAGGVVAAGGALTGGALVLNGGGAARAGGAAQLDGFGGDADAELTAASVAVDALTLAGALTLDVTGDARLNAPGAARLLGAVGGDLTLAAVDAAQIDGAAVAGLLDIAVSAGGASVADADLGALRIDAADGATVTTSAIHGDASLDAGGAATVSEATINGALDLRAGGDATLTTVDVGGATDLAAGGDADLSDLALGGDALVVAGGALAVDELASAASVDLRAGQGIAVSRLAAAGDAILEGGMGDILLTGLVIDGALGAMTEGDILSWSPDGAGERIEVAGDARFDAGGDVLLFALAEAAPTPVFAAARLVQGGRPADLPSGFAAGAHVFGGAVSVTRAQNVALQTESALTLGATAVAFSTAAAETEGGIFDRTSGDAISGWVRLAAGGDLGLAGGAAIRAAGDLRAESGGDAQLASGNEIGGAASFDVAGDLDWAENGSILLAAVTVGGDLRLTAGQDGADGDAAIRQGGTATVAALAAEAYGASGLIAGPATESFAGALTVDGDADFASGWGQGLDLAGALTEGADRDVTLDDADNVFGGSVALRRIAGDATVIEESSLATLAADDNDAGALHLRQIEVLGSIRVVTSDDVIFDGRMTSLLDDEIPAARPTLPDGPSTEDVTAQGDAALAEADFHLFLSDFATLTVDATAGGLDTGGLIRFDRAVDGNNARLADRNAGALAARQSGGAMVLYAGTGDIRVRDYIGAGAPIGDFTIFSAHDVSLGHTYAARDPDAQTPDTRYLYGDGETLSDFLFAADMRIEATGRVIGFVPGDLSAMFERTDDYYGINVASFTYGQIFEPEALSLVGFISGSSAKAAGLFPNGPRSPDYSMNGCVIGDVNDCTGVSPPEVIVVPRIERALILNVEREDLLELFVSYGNEELWGVPSGYLDDLDGLALQCEDSADPEECRRRAVRRAQGS